MHDLARGNENMVSSTKQQPSREKSITRVWPSGGRNHSTSAFRMDPLFSHLNRFELKPSSFPRPLRIIKYLLNVLVYAKHLKENKKVALPPSPVRLQVLCAECCKGANWSQLLSFLLCGHSTTETLLRPQINSCRSLNSTQKAISA